MSGIDVIVVGAFALMVVTGFVSGFARRALPWLGWLLGATALLALSPKLLHRIGSDGSTGRFALGLGLALLGGSIGATVGRVLGARLHQIVERAHLGGIDRLVGGLFGGATVVITAWLLLPAMADVHGWPSRAVRESSVARVLVERLGQPPRTLNGLATALGLDGLPRVFEGVQVAPTVEAPPPHTPLSPEELATAQAAVLKVTGVACDQLVSGSAVVVERGLLVTNAHVVAGVTDPRIEVGDERVPAQVVAFDPSRDVAVLRALVDRTPLRWGTPNRGGEGAAIGFPRGGPQKVEPARVSEEVQAEGRDIYDSARTSRQVLVVAASLAPGDSGGALVDDAGDLIGLVFAIAPDRDGVAYALAPSEVEAVTSDAGDDEVGTGACTR